jgi:[ribosomal protein S18]-alanine N-acetyltransferase
MIRDAVPSDAKALYELEERCFEREQMMSEMSFRRILRRKTAAVVVEDEGGTLRGYALVLFRSTTSIARLYSICTLPTARGKGIARQLLAACEARAAARGATRLRLEVNAGNATAQKLYNTTETGVTRCAWKRRSPDGGALHHRRGPRRRLEVAR